jgi:hypothetical protein
MKKTMLLVWFAAVVATYSQAQYFQRQYSDNSGLDNGMFTKTTGAGHVMAGVNRTGLTSDYNLMVIRTNPNGGFTTASHFNKSYVITDPSGHNIQFTAGHVIEYANGTGYGVFGSFSFTNSSSPTGVSQGLAFIRLDLFGNPVIVQGYQTTVPTISVTLKGTYESKQYPSDIFVAAHVLGPGETSASYIWVMRVDINGVIVWGNIYDISTPTANFEVPEDIIESPYFPEVLIVGGLSYPGTTGDENGFCLRLNNGTGAHINVEEYVGALSERLTAINVSSDPGNTGFIMCGYTNTSNAGYAWVMKTLPTTLLMWSYLYSEGLPVEEIKPYDVVGRLNTTGHYEYYVTGKKDKSFQDAIVIKLDASGLPVNPGALFVYQTGPTFAHCGYSIDIMKSNGICMYGTWEDPFGSPVNKLSYVVKAYFNGISGCNESFKDINRTIYGVGQRGYPTILNGLMTYPLSHLATIVENDIQLCFATSIPGGSNAFQTSVKSVASDDKHILLFPNPFNAKDQFVTLQLQSQTSEPASLSITDMLGRQVYNNNYQLKAGENQLQVSLGSLGLPKGIYQVIIEKASGTEVLKLTVN